MRSLLTKNIFYCVDFIYRSTVAVLLSSWRSQAYRAVQLRARNFLLALRSFEKKTMFYFFCSRSLPEYQFSRYVTIHAFSLGMLENLYE